MLSASEPLSHATVRPRPPAILVRTSTIRPLQVLPAPVQNSFPSQGADCHGPGGNAAGRNPKMKLAFSTLGCPEWNLEQILSAACASGYEGVEWRGYQAE